MRKPIPSTIFANACAAVAMVLAVSAASPTQAAANLYAERGALSQYLIDDSAAEIALARSAAPTAISAKADIMVLERTGYRTSIKGTNGFVCMVWRSWSDDLADPQLWNPKVRAPICLNPIAVRTVLPAYIERTGWVIAGLDRAGMQARYAAAAATGALQLPAPGAIAYMMARQGYLADGVGHAAPHIMFFVPRADRQDWGANLTGSPIWGAESQSDPIAMFFVTVPHWSDGTPAMAM